MVQYERAMFVGVVASIAMTAASVAGEPRLVPANGNEIEVRPKVSRMASFECVGGQYILTSEWIESGADVAAQSGLTAVEGYDALAFSMDDVDLDGIPDGLVCGGGCVDNGGPSGRWFFGYGDSVVADDFVLRSDTPSSVASFEGFVSYVALDGGQCDRLYTFLSVWSQMDTTGTGFDTDFDGTVDDAIDRTCTARSFGGVVTEWVTPSCPDLDLDGLPDGSVYEGNALLGAGYPFDLPFGQLGLDLIVPAAGSFELIIARDYIDTDGDGEPDTPVPSPNAAPFYFGTAAPQFSLDGSRMLHGTPGCPDRVGRSTGALWQSDTLGFSEDEFFVLESEPGGVLCPDPISVAMTLYTSPPNVVLDDFIGRDCNNNFRSDFEDIWLGSSEDINGDSVPDECSLCRNRRCADVNANGLAPEPADFTAWLALFNNPGSAGSYRADVNNNGLSQDPPDFTAWLGYFNNPASDPSDCLD